MKKWKQVLTQGLVAGSLASLFSTALLALTGRCEASSAVAPVNAASHRLPTEALVAVYAALAVGLAAGALACRDRYAATQTRDELPPGQTEPRIVRHVRAGNI